MRKLKAMAAVMTAAAALAVGTAKADLPLVGPGGIDVGQQKPVVPAPAAPARLIVTWNGGTSEASLDNMTPVPPPPGSPAGTLAWVETVAGVGTGVVLMNPAVGGGWEIYGLLNVAGGPNWTIPRQPWVPGLGRYQAHALDNPTITAVGRINIGPSE